MGYKDIEDARMYQRAEKVADRVWDVVVDWDQFARDTLGKQLTRSADSIGANIAEGAGRFGPKDVIRFMYFARGSLRETRFWLRRATQRDLISAETNTEIMQELRTLYAEINGFIKFQRGRVVRESEMGYSVNEDEFEYGN